MGTQSLTYSRLEVGGRPLPTPEGAVLSSATGSGHTQPTARGFSAMLAVSSVPFAARDEAVRVLVVPFGGPRFPFGDLCLALAAVTEVRPLSWLLCESSAFRSFFLLEVKSPAKNLQGVSTQDSSGGVSP